MFFYQTRRLAARTFARSVRIRYQSCHGEARAANPIKRLHRRYGSCQPWRSICLVFGGRDGERVSFCIKSSRAVSWQFSVTLEVYAAQYGGARGLSGIHQFARRVMPAVSLATVEFKPAGAGTRLIFTEQAAFLDDFGDGGGRQRGTAALLELLEADLQKSSPSG
jgi:hypothetical protein